MCDEVKHVGHSVMPISIVSEEVRSMTQELQEMSVKLQRKTGECILYMQTANQRDADKSNVSMADVFASDKDFGDLSPPMSVAELIRCDFAVLRTALDLREEALLSRLSSVYAAQSAKRIYVYQHRVKQFEQSCDLMSSRVAAALNATSDAELMKNGSIIMNEFKLLAADAFPPPSDCNEQYTFDYSLKLLSTSNRLSALGSITCKGVCATLSSSSIVKSGTILELTEVDVAIQLKDFQGDCIETGGDEALFSAMIAPSQCDASFNCLRHKKKTPVSLISVNDCGRGSYMLRFSAPKAGEYDISIEFCETTVGVSLQFTTLAAASTAWTLGSKGHGPGHFMVPWGVCTGPGDLLFVSDSKNSRIEVFRKSDGAYIRSIGSHGSGVNQIRNPRGIFCSNNEVLYVVDAGNCRVQVYDPTNGNHIVQLFKKGVGPGFLRGPWGVVVGSDGNVYVSDMNCHCIQICTTSGVFIGSIGCIGNNAGQFLYPRGLCCSSNGILYVADLSNHRFQAFSIKDSTYLFEVKDCSPMDISVGADGKVFLTDFDEGNIAIFDESGLRIRSIGTRGSNLNQLLNPCGLCYDLNGLLYVADAGNFRVQILR